MIPYLSDFVKINENGEVEIPYERVIFEKQKRITNNEVIVTYVFDDQSSVTVKYTPEVDLIIERKKGNLNAKLKKQY